MKLVWTIFFFVALIFFAPITHGEDYKKTIILEVRSIANSEENINKAKLLLRYAGEYQDNIKQIQERYEIAKSPLVDDSLREIDQMKQALKKIQTKQVEKSDAEWVLSSVIKELKNISTGINPYLKSQQKKYEDELDTIKWNYVRIGNLISNALYNFIESFSLKLSEIDTLTIKQKQLVESLVRLNKSRESINAFSRLSFRTKGDMKDFYTSIIQSIKDEFQTIRWLLR